MKLQTLNYPTEQICNEEALYLHREKGFLLFDGFFNLFYLEKHHKYCDLTSLTLEADIRGIRRIVLMHDRDEIREVRFDDIPVSGMDRLKGRVNYLDQDRRVSLEFPYESYDKGVFWIKAEPEDMDGEWSIRGHFEGQPGETAVGAAELAVNICTFRREAYVSGNMRSLADWFRGRDIDDRTPEAAEHLHVFIVDNGQSLDKDQEFAKATKSMLEKGILEVIPNANTGGTGGFSRGMKRAMELRKELSLTHILMMDDDAVFDPDLFVRLYGFLSTIRQEYAGITVGGALMREDYRYIQHASGEWYGQFRVNNDHLMEDLRDYNVCTSDFMTETESDRDLYGAWWCCCYHMDAVTQESLPLPLFVHHDDIQFGLGQLSRGIVFLNGICVWHQGFELVFPGVKQYYNMRNTLITSMLYEPEYMKKNLKLWCIRRYIGMLISYRYADCAFVYEGLMDFLKGKKWLLQSDPELIHKQLMAEYNKRCPFLYYEQIKDYVKDVATELTVEELKKYYSYERFKGAISRKLTFNGWFLPGDDELKVITPLDSPWDTYRHRRVLLYEPGSKRGAIMKRSAGEFFRWMGRLMLMCLAIDRWKITGAKWD